MPILLVPVDASPTSNRAVEEAIRLARQSANAQIHLLNVQPRIFAEISMVYLEPAKIDSFYFDQGSKALAPAEKLLKNAGIAFTAHRGTGPIAETIIAKAHELGADTIVMGTHGHGRVAGTLLGSVSTKVLALSDVPVTLVRATAAEFSGRLP
jgi:nucleotide-binding universal stress UspA family protein